MTAPSDMVVFGEDWGRHPSSTQHLIRRLAADRNIVWVNSIGLRRPRVTARDLQRVADKLLPRTRTVPAAIAPPSSVSILPPLAVSWPGSRIAAAVNRQVLGHQVRRAMERRGLRSPVFWTSLPSAVPLVGSLNERAVVYYCGDDFGSLAGVDHAPVRKMERALVDRADLIVAASAQLAERFPRDRTLLLPHGTDLDLFQHAAPRAADLPSGRPIAGFYGSLSSWIDVELIASVAACMPDWSFALVGEIRTDVEALRKLPNVRLLGPRAHHELPSYVQHWNVSLLPFRDCPQIHACNPLKLREYLATGTPIASTPFPALGPFDGLIEVASSSGDFAEAIRRAAAGARNNDRRRNSVARDSWESRAAELDNAMASL